MMNSPPVWMPATASLRVFPSEGALTPSPRMPRVRPLASRMSLSVKNKLSAEAMNAIGIRGPISLIE